MKSPECNDVVVEAVFHMFRQKYPGLVEQIGNAALREMSATLVNDPDVKDFLKEVAQFI